MDTQSPQIVLEDSLVLGAQGISLDLSCTSAVPMISAVAVVDGGVVNDCVVNDCTIATPPPAPASADVVNDGTMVTGPGSIPAAVSSPAMSQLKKTLENPGMPPKFGNFEVVRKLGEGGMGAVYQGRETHTGQLVAIKVLSNRFFQQPMALERFFKEVRLLKEVNNPYVANLIDSGDEEGSPYLAMEFVPGPDLKQMLIRCRMFDERTSLKMVADICRALLPAHAMGIVHRDIKPANLLMVAEEAEIVEQKVTGIYLKLTDFGLARHIDQSESLQLTQTGAMLGTPYYMAPEQIGGVAELTPSVDVYAMGITLFELLSGQRPFDSTDMMKLAGMHCFSAVPSLQKQFPELSDGVVRIVEKALAKEPHARYPDAASMLCDIERLLRGETSGKSHLPVVTTQNPQNVVSGSYEWELNATTEEIWKHVCNTERVNHAMGLPAVNYELIRAEGEPTKLFGKVRLCGIPIRWEEHPFEWIEGRRMSVLRQFEKGPFEWFISSVTMSPRPGGGTTLKHSLQISPRGVFGKIFAKQEVGSKGKKGLNRVYSRIEKTCTSQLSQTQVVDPFIETPTLKRATRSRLEQRLDQLVEHGVSPKFQLVLHELLSNAAAQDLARLKPIAMAKRFGMKPDEALKGCLYAVKVGLLTMHWDILCPTCRIASEVKNTLQELKEHAYCEACDISYDVDFGKSLELIFRVHPEIRTADLKVYCIGGPTHFPHVVAQLMAGPGERIEFDLNLSAGGYILRSSQLPYTVPLIVNNDRGTRHLELKLTREFDRRIVPNLRAGGQLLAVSNDEFTEPLILRIERTATSDEVITAAQVSTSALFRELFPDQVLSPGMLVRGAVHSFLAADLIDLDQLYDQHGDVKAVAILQAFRKIILSSIPTDHGTVVELSEDRLLAVFADATDAVRAGLQLPQRLKQDPLTAELNLRLAVHRGATLVATDHQEIRYFGAHVNRVRQLPAQSHIASLLLTAELQIDPQVQSLLAEHFPGAPLKYAASSESTENLILHCSVPTSKVLTGLFPKLESSIQ
jgi:serine/threonine protein kinase/class 3 adenylate cyclase